jgi:hypothetical protein
VDGSFSDAAPFSGEEDSRREGLREKLVRSLETHRNRIAAEVDERSAELTARAAELEEEQARLTAAEAAVKARASRLEDLGIAADGEHAAVVDRLLTLLEKRDAEIAELSAKVLEPTEPEPVEAVPAPPAPAEPPARAHLLFVPTGQRYQLVGREGPAPAIGAEIALEGGRRFVVSKLASSPLPADERRCAYLEALA